jgi:c-di-AMP phosphodiesterase-like protein
MPGLALIILALEILVFAFAGNIKVAVALAAVFVPLLFETLESFRNKKMEWKALQHYDAFARQTFWKEVFNLMPAAVAIIDEQGKILWENEAFVSLFEGRTRSRNLFSNLIPPDLVQKILSGSDIEELRVKDRIFSVNSRFLEKNSKKGGRELRALYFQDITRIYDLGRKLNDEKVAVLYIQVDNFDEITAACPDESRPELLARVDKTLSQWIQSYDGFIKKYDSDKFVAILSLKNFRRVEETRFNILEEIKEIKVGLTMTVTLSIGAAFGQGSFLEVSKNAQNALELCQGRGGDQVVVKAEGKTYFYGGKAKEVEKYSRVRARVIAHALRDLIEESDIVLVLGHVFLDMDALGAGVGIVRAAKSLGKAGYIVLSPEQSPSVESLLELLSKDEELRREFVQEEAALEKATRKTLSVVVDTHRPSLCLSQKVLEKVERVVVIDHHRRGEEFIDKALLVYLEPHASSTSEMVTEMLEYMGEEIRLSPLEATALLSGIAVDTRNFAFKTGARTFEAASFLRRLGADPTTVYKLFQEDMDTVNARAEVIKRAQPVFDHIVLSYYTEKPKNPTLSAAQAANSLLEIKGVYASFVLVPIDDGISVSSRSLGNINVQMILEKLGGGGHMTVAGAQLKDVTMEQAIEKVKQAIYEYVKEGETS